MQSNPYFKPLKFNQEFFDKARVMDEVKDSFYGGIINGHWKKWGYKTDLLSPVLHTLLDDLNCEVLAVEVFYTAPNNLISWHTDMGPNTKDFIKINFVWGSDDHTMEWGESIAVNKSYDLSPTQAGTTYVHFKKEEVEFTTSHKLVSPTIVNVGRPHRVINNSLTNGRWCLCLIPGIKGRPGRIMFDEALDIFNEYVQD